MTIGLLAKSASRPIFIAAAIMASVSGCATARVAPQVSASLSPTDALIALHDGSKRGSLVTLPPPRPAAESVAQSSVGKAVVDLSSPVEQSAEQNGSSDFALTATEIPNLTSPTSVDVRVAELERQVQWFRDDVARMQTLLANFEQDAASTSKNGIVHRQQVLQQQVAALQHALSEAHRNDEAQQLTIDELSRRIAEMKARLVREREEETQALDGVIHQMEQLLQFQAEQSMRQRISDGGGDAL